MPNRPRITTVILDLSEELEDEQGDAHADGTVTPEENTRLAEIETTLHRVAVDATQGVVQGLRLIHVTPATPQDHHGLVKHISDYIAARRAAHADGTVTPIEHDDLTRRQRLVYATAMHLDVAVSEAVTLMRCGPSAPWATRRRNERRKAERNHLTLMKGGKDHRGGPSAA